MKRRWRSRRKPRQMNQSDRLTDPRDKKEIAKQMQHLRSIQEAEW